jgi:eukaryotic-like serine/threonine-protein kinase
MRIGSERFTVERVVGTGAMGTVFYARDRETGDPVAFKVLRRDGRFAREVEALERLAHPRIVRYVAHGETGQGEPFLAMEWVEGTTLRARLPEATLHGTIALGLAIAEALAAAHAAGVVHRDVKPSNILLPAGRYAEAKLADFGIARVAAERSTLTGTGDVVGTPLYMAPEQLVAPSPASDVYSLGCVLHECLTGKLPGQVTMRALRPELPAAATTSIEQLVQKDVRKRPGNGAAALDLLAALRDAGLAEVGRPTSFDRLKEADSAPQDNAVTALTVAVLGKHLAMPLAILRAQCDRHGLDVARLTADDVARLAPALAEAVSRFTSPGTREALEAELRALVDDTLGIRTC